MKREVKQGILTASALILSMLSAAAHADALPAGWSGIGDAGAYTNGTLYPVGTGTQIVLTTASVLYEDDFPLSAGALNFSGTAATDVGIPGGVESFMGVALGSLDTAELAAYEGSAAKSSFNVSAGDVLHLRWNLLSADAQMPDSAWIAIDGQLTQLAKASDASSVWQSGVMQTGYQDFSYTFTHAGAVSVGFAVVDAGDYNGSSTLMLDQIGVSAVPEPHAFVAMLMGLGVLGLIRRRA